MSVGKQTGKASIFLPTRYIFRVQPLSLGQKKEVVR